VGQNPSALSVFGWEVSVKKIYLIVCLAWSSLLIAEELVSVTGPVVSAEVVRGHSDELVYTVRDLTTGKEYKAVTLRSDIARNEEIFKEALKSGQDLYIEFIPHSKFPDNIFKIIRIELKGMPTDLVGFGRSLIQVIEETFSTCFV
jgi:hypothetical protein